MQLGSLVLPLCSVSFILSLLCALCFSQPVLFVPLCFLELCFANTTAFVIFDKSVLFILPSSLFEVLSASWATQLHKHDRMHDLKTSQQTNHAVCVFFKGSEENCSEGNRGEKRNHRPAEPAWLADPLPLKCWSSAAMRGFLINSHCYKIIIASK